MLPEALGESWHSERDEANRRPRGESRLQRGPSQGEDGGELSWWRRWSAYECGCGRKANGRRASGHGGCKRL